MTTAVATRPEPTGLAALAAMQAAPNPLLLIPRECREPVSALWVANAHLLPSVLSLCATVRSVTEQGLTAADLRAVVLALLDPARRATHKFASDVISDLCGMAAKCIARRKSRTAAAERVAESEAFKVARLTAGDLFRGGGTAGEPAARPGSGLPVAGDGDDAGADDDDTDLYDRPGYRPTE